MRCSVVRFKHRKCQYIKGMRDLGVTFRRMRSTCLSHSFLAQQVHGSCTSTAAASVACQQQLEALLNWWSINSEAGHSQVLPQTYSQVHKSISPSHQLRAWSKLRCSNSTFISDSLNTVHATIPLYSSILSLNFVLTLQLKLVQRIMFPLWLCATHALALH